jgi:hypothetical protein
MLAVVERETPVRLFYPSANDACGTGKKWNQKEAVKNSYRFTAKSRGAEEFPARRLTLAGLDRIFLSRSTEQLAAFRF